MQSFLGGVLIGVAVTAMLFFNGRVAGVSGIISGVLTRPTSSDRTRERWRWAFIAGLVIGGAMAGVFNRDLFVNLSGRSVIEVATAGLLVGFGTVMAGGCTSGHGVCGVSRLSRRSIVATLVFMFFGFLTVAAMRFWGTP